MNFFATHGIHAVQLPEAAQLTPAPALSAILAPMRELIAARFLRTILAPIILPLWNYLKRVERRFARLAILHAAGQLPTPRPAASRTRSAAPGPRLPFPTQRAWFLKALKHEAAYFRTRLEAFLAEPATAALIAACPRAAGTLSRVFHMLGMADPRPRRATTPRPTRRQPAHTQPAPRQATTAARTPAPEPPPDPLAIGAIAVGSGLVPRPAPVMCPSAAARWPFHPDLIRKKPA